MPRARRAGILRLIPHFLHRGQANHTVETSPADDAPFAPSAPDGDHTAARRALRGKSSFEQRVVNDVKDAAAWARTVVAGFANAFDIDRNVDKLKNPGDTYTQLLNGEVYVEAGLYGTDDVDVSLDQSGKYIVTGGGEVGAGLWGQLGGQLGAKFDVQGLVSLGVGTRAEMTFDTAADAKRAAHILARQQQATLLEATSPAMFAVAARLAPTEADLAFLKDHVSAVSLYGDGIADLNAVAGLNLQGPLQAGLFGDASATAQAGIRLELARGQVTGLTVQHQLVGDVNLAAGLKTKPGDNEAWTSGLLGGDANAQVTAEVHYPPPLGPALTVEGGHLLTGLAGWLRDARSDRATVTVDLNATGGGSGQTRGVQLETRFEGDPHALVQTGALASALHGQIRQAMQQAGSAIKVEVTKTPFVQEGVNVNPGLSLMGVGLECTVTAQTQRFAPPSKQASNELGESGL